MAKKIPEYLVATFFSKTAAELPQSAKIGNIIRIHRGQTKSYKGGFQINCDVNIKGAWALFDATDSFIPVSKTGKRHTFIAQDKIRLKEIREFAKEFFAENEMRALTLQEARKKKPGDFDTLGYVLEIKTKGEFRRIRICDTTKIAKLRMPTSRYLSFGPGDVVYIRSAYYDGESENRLIFKDYSNILKVPKETKDAMILLDLFKKKKAAEDVLDQIDFYTPEINTSVVVSEVFSIHKKLKVTKLKDLYSGDPTKYGNKCFRVNVNVIEIGPKNPQDWLCVFDTKTKKQ